MPGTGSVGIALQGTRLSEKTVAAFVRKLPIVAKIIGKLTIKEIAIQVQERAKGFAPVASGSLKAAIRSKKNGTNSYIVYVKRISPWGGKKSRVAAKVYPIAQERGYRPHKIHTSMIKKSIRGRYEPEGHSRVITVGKGSGKSKGFTPYLLPALREATAPNSKSRKTAFGKFNYHTKKEVAKLVRIANSKGNPTGFTASFNI